MIYLTHVAFAALLGIISWGYLAPSTGAETFFLTVIIGSLLPDVDHEKSIVGRWFHSPLLGHRRFFHSAACALMISLAVLLLSKSYFLGLALALGYLSHIFLDSLTRRGVMLFWPAKLMVGGPFKTGGIFDYALFTIISALCLTLLFIKAV